MTREEYSILLGSLLDSDKAAENVVRLKDEVDNTLIELETLKAENEALKASNNTLRDTNAQLALRVTAGVNTPSTPPENTPETALQALINKIKED